MLNKMVIKAQNEIGEGLCFVSIFPKKSQQQFCQLFVAVVVVNSTTDNVKDLSAIFYKVWVVECLINNPCISVL